MSRRTKFKNPHPKKLVITEEEKARWKDIMLDTWNAIGYDVIQANGGNAKRRDVIEMVCDADMPVFHSYMTQEEYRVLGRWYGKPSFMAWMKEIFPNNDYVI